MDCFQHPGRFLYPGTGPGQLTQSWQTYTYCFDRDLYPLSLPSNMTTEQRNNVGASILKIQFQFNQGKDYSGSYPSTAIYPKFAYSLPFDFWVDDIQMVSGECSSPVTSPSNGSPAKAFPQNTAVGTCAPATNASKFAGAIAQAYAVWQKNFVQNDHIVAPEQSNAITSEAMGYGMMITAAMGDKALFDKFYGYVKNNLQSGLMKWRDGGNGSASDADADIAYALYMANAQWPSGGYKAGADAMATAILSQDVVSNVIRGGSMFQGSPFNASYFAPAAYRVFQRNGAAGFATVITTNFGLVNANVGAATSGVPTDWANPSSGLPSGPGSAMVTSMITDGENGAMGYDSARVPPHGAGLTGFVHRPDGRGRHGHGQRRHARSRLPRHARHPRERRLQPHVLPGDGGPADGPRHERQLPDAVADRNRQGGPRWEPPCCAQRFVQRFVQRTFSAASSARAAPMAVLTWRRSSGGGRTAGRPSDWIQSSRHQPFEW
jgi:hypothetical protein